MIKEFIGTGKTIEEATLAAKAGLNAPITADIKIEIVAMPKKKVLGLFGGCDAQVKASFEDDRKERNPVNRKPSRKPRDKRVPVYKTPVEQEPKKVKEPKPVQAPKPVHEPKPRPKKERPEYKLDSSINIDLDYVTNYLKTILDGFKIDDAKVEAVLNNDVVEIDIQTESIGIIIGHRGETLDALQYLTSLAIKRATDTYVRVIVNVGNYRNKRENTLRSLAEKNANYVLKTGRRYGFEPMNPYERRIIHTTIQDIEGVTSRSVGSGVDRRVLIEPVGGVKDNGPRRNSRNAKAPVAVDPNREKRVDRADIPKFGKIEVNKD